MRRILVDFARAKRYQKRGGGAIQVTLVDDVALSEPGRDLVALDDALEALAKHAAPSGPAADSSGRSWRSSSAGVPEDRARRPATAGHCDRAGEADLVRAEPSTRSKRHRGNGGDYRRGWP